ncbi:MAG: plastocyanin/azurin family copper-binding protein [Pseudomonadota bacterium]
MTPRWILLPLPAALAATLVAAGCGGGESSAPVATTAVTMAKSYRFEPRTIEVDAGATVTWTNDDNFTHTVHVDGRADHEVDRGETVSIRFEEPGTYHYVCTLHRRDMDGTVIVR